MIHNHEDIANDLNDYFSDLLKEPSIDRVRAIREITNNIHVIFNQDHNKMLLRKITMRGVEEAIMTMPNREAPGPNGFTTDFYKACWPFIKEEVHALVEESMVNKSVLRALNATFLTLIPKEEGVDSPDRFRPISLCNVIYRIISKVLTNRIKTILPLLISSNQLGYVEGRQILDIIILSHELIHSVKS